MSTLSNYVAKLATNENICYVLTGNDFDFNLFFGIYRIALGLVVLAVAVVSAMV